MSYGVPFLFVSPWDSAKTNACFYKKCALIIGVISVFSSSELLKFHLLQVTAGNETKPSLPSFYLLTYVLINNVSLIRHLLFHSLS